MGLLAIIRRIDTNGDAMITYDELGEFLKPEDPPTGHDYGPIPEPRPMNVEYGARGGSPMRARSPVHVSVAMPPREVRQTIVQAPYEQVISAPIMQPVPRKPILAPWNEEQQILTLKQ